MKLRITFALFTAMVIGVPALTGCDETVSDKKQVEVKDDGTVKKTEEKVTREADGTIKKEETKKVDVPNK